MRLNDKVAVISGGARGMGAAEAKLFASEGCNVIIGDILEEESLKTASEIRKNGGKCTFLKLDVRKEKDWENLVSYAIEEYGKIDILVNNAGLTTDGHVETLSLDEWNRIMDVNVTGVFLGCKHVLPSMSSAKRGSIINISSQLGFVGAGSSNPAYQASKGAVRILTKNIAVRYASYNVRCNSVHPGPVDTPMTETARSDKEFLASLIDKIPMGRIGRPKEVAWAVLYLASDESSYVTGIELLVDGGWVAQ